MSFWPGLLLAVFIVSGVTLKLADFFGEKGGNILQYFSAAISALTLGLLVSESSYSSSIILGIIFGVALSGKINRLNLVLGLVLTLLIAGILGFQPPTLWLLIVVSTSSFIDEFLHDRFTEKKSCLKRFFRFRPILKLVMISLAVLSFIEFIYALAFWSFDLAYDATDWLLVRREFKSAFDSSEE